MAVRFHSQGDIPTGPGQKLDLPTVHASTTAFRLFLRLIDRDGAFHVRRWSNELYLEEDFTLTPRVEDAMSPELLAILDAAEWAEEGAAAFNQRSAAPRVATETVDEQPLLHWDESLFDQLLCDEEECSYAHLPLQSRAASTAQLAMLAVPPTTVTKPRIQKSRSVDATTLQVVPHRSYADEKSIRAFMDSCRDRLSWRRHRQLFLSGFRIFLTHDLDVIVNETAHTTTLFKSESTLAGLDQVDIWLEAMLTGSDQVGLIRTDDTATALKDPQIHLVSSDALRPDELTQRKTMIASYELLSFLAQNCTENKSYRLFRAGLGSQQLVLLEEPEEGEASPELEEAVPLPCDVLARRDGVMTPLDVQLTVASECLQVGSRLQNAGYPQVCCRLIKSAREVLLKAAEKWPDADLVESMLTRVNCKLWLSTLEVCKSGEWTKADILDACEAYCATRDVPLGFTSRFLAEVEFVHAFYTCVTASAKDPEHFSLPESSICLVVAYLLRFHSLASILDRARNALNSDADTTDAGGGFRGLPWLAIAFGVELVTVHNRLSTLIQTLLLPLPQGSDIVGRIRMCCSNWRQLQELWKANSHHQSTEDVLRQFGMLLDTDSIHPLACTSLFHPEDFRLETLARIWAQWYRSAVAFKTGTRAPTDSPKSKQALLETITDLFARADELLSSDEDCAHSSECFGESLLLMVQILNDLAVMEVFSLDAKRRRENLRQAINQLILAMHFLRLQFAILVTRHESARPEYPDATMPFTCVADWICVVGVNLVRAVQLNSSTFRVCATSDNIRAASQEGGCYHAAEEVNSCFSKGQYDAYMSAIALATRVHAFSRTLVGSRFVLKKPWLTLEQCEDLPLQVGLSCDQMLHMRVSVLPHSNFSTSRLSAICQERIPYMSMSMAVDMMQYSPIQKTLVSDDRWKKSSPEPLFPADLIDCAARLDLPKTRELMRSGKRLHSRYPTECVKACIELSEPLIDTLFHQAVAALVPEPVEIEHMLHPGSAFIDGASLLTTTAYPQSGFVEWLTAMEQLYPRAARQNSRPTAIPFLYKSVPRDPAFANQVSRIDVMRIPKEELIKWVPSSLDGLLEERNVREAALSVRRPKDLMEPRTPDSFPSIPAKLPFGAKTGATTSEAGGLSRDLATIIQTQLQSAAQNFRVDEREAAAAHYHLGVFLNTINSHAEQAGAGHQGVVQRKLREKRRTQAIEHLRAAFKAFNPAQCLKDFINVANVLYSIMEDAGSLYEATATVLAADWEAADCKNKHPENSHENEHFVHNGEEYIGVSMLRKLACAGVLKLLKQRPKPLRIAPIDPASSSCSVHHRTEMIRDALEAANETQLRALYTLLLRKQESCAAFFCSEHTQ